MADHDWVPTVLREPSFKHDEVRFFPHCFDCGAQAAPFGSRVVYRATARDEWTFERPPCVPPQRDSAGKGEG